MDGSIKYDIETGFQVVVKGLQAGEFNATYPLETDFTFPTSIKSGETFSVGADNVVPGESELKVESMKFDKVALNLVLDSPTSDPAITLNINEYNNPATQVIEEINNIPFVNIPSPDDLPDNIEPEALLNEELPATVTSPNPSRETVPIIEATPGNVSHEFK